MYADAPIAGHPTEALVGGQNGYPAIPTSAAHIAEQMESGGARVEETLVRLNCKYQTLFFCAGMAAVTAGVIGGLTSLLTLQLACLVNSTFLLVFGFVMMLLDVPGAPRWAGRYRSSIRKYFRFLTRLTGKALWLLFLGSMTAVTLWPSNRQAHALLFFTICLSFFVSSVAIVGLLIAIRKSLRLEKVRKAILMSCKGAYIDVYRKYAMTDPQHGMQFEEFNRLCADVTGGRLQFDITDLGIIYNALDDHQKSAINEREFSEWMTGSMTYL
ncbi:putative COPI associated protein [Toxoplasma gondii TgCatPRC2]|uniref:COPI associated protein, putative n=15 Tax=Toxoplasma gondii TaxID=5811 RepID=B9PKM9_TOXGV|nr:COPI associated protein, putative [Toxoplasma gondii ME49]EPR62813.1 putative COPI associated protein [Toxoplasma gondii GT1]ESS32065.1 putative COPI associated protein [Toxoplasma gondii VEG]KAF4641174.1 putative COPI associated protein [Toxoplasma gondii]KFG39915.1 putative COPI associated protein [Toxoplasma gondii p89]KFG40317.1 putative COPI associated protein [Toxoplasma gondii FOU]KFG49183.1 putative COPI associated protein [Toxoplasma gondii GAB2-2007-GAL-DOM2]KFG65325.1 putative |eukprot:XP_008882994.1 COPI associated protein, putative [Hammondia hammondi]